MPRMWHPWTTFPSEQVCWPPNEKPESTALGGSPLPEDVFTLTKLILKQGIDSDLLFIKSELPISLTSRFSVSSNSEHFGAAQRGSPLPLFKTGISASLPIDTKLPVPLSTFQFTVSLMQRERIVLMSKDGWKSSLSSPPCQKSPFSWTTFHLSFAVFVHFERVWKAQSRSVSILCTMKDLGPSLQRHRRGVGATGAVLAHSSLLVLEGSPISDHDLFVASSLSPCCEAPLARARLKPTEQHSTNERGLCLKNQCATFEKKRLCYVICVWGQWSSDQDDHPGQKSNNETRVENPQGCSGFVVFLGWHQTSIRRHLDQRKFHTWWVEQYSSFVQHQPCQLSVLC